MVYYMEAGLPPKEPMTLQDRLLAIKPARRDAMENLFEKLDQETLDTLRALLANPAISTRSIHQALRDEGYSIDRETINAYRKKTTSATQ